MPLIEVDHILSLSQYFTISHANSMDDLLGAMLDIDDSVAEIMDWIKNNGGYEKNALYVTADHDHYLTLLPRKWRCTAQHIWGTLHISPQFVHICFVSPIAYTPFQTSPKLLPTWLSMVFPMILHLKITPAPTHGSNLFMQVVMKMTVRVRRSISKTSPRGRYVTSASFWHFLDFLRWF